jgi:hypothetical protein
LQRLFSTFADGWPGAGLLFQRLLAGAMLLYCGIACMKAAPPCVTLAPQIIGVGAGILLLAGLWTPVAGTLVAISELWVAFLRPGDLLIPIILAALGSTLAMIGPGAWSIDARLFGRKHLKTPHL